MTEKFLNIVAQMTTEEKVTLLTGNGLWRTAPLLQHGINDIVMTDGTYGVRYSSDQIDGDGNWSMNDFITVVNQTADQVIAESESAEQEGFWEETFGATKPATCFPNGSSLACCWDIDLVYKMGEALAAECQHFGVGILLGPGINIRRTPLAGRGYEYYSEDPVVSGDLAAALINGLQDNGVGASLKHFAANNSEFRRTEMDSVIDERALREIYLYGFQRAIEKANPWTVMSSYNRLNGVQTSNDPFLLTTVLRDEWQYDGLVMSDWYGIKDRPASLRAGNDLSMPESNNHKKVLLSAIEEGAVGMDVVDRSCIRMLSLVDKVLRNKKPDATVDFSQNHALSQQIAAESIVLLKNEDDILPLDPKKVSKIAVLGKPAQTPVIQGSGCATTVPYLLDRPLDEIFDVAGENFKVKWAVGAPDNESSDSDALEEALILARESDVAVIFVSTAVGDDGENGDRCDLNILPGHEKLIREVAKVQPNIVVVMANSDAAIMPWLPECKAVLETFFAGQGMGRAVAEILFGQRNPCGKLTVTVPHSLEETPAWLHYPGENLRHHYSEGLFVGYRYYDKRKLSPQFPFGFGLSYTQFAYSNLVLSDTNLDESSSLLINVDITNIGDRAGKEIVQLYVNMPAGGLIREEQALKSFVKVDLQPGETRTVSLSVRVKDLACYHPGLADWTVVPGIYEIRVGKSSRDIVLTEKVIVTCPTRHVALKDDATIQMLLEQPKAFDRVVKLIHSKTLHPEASIKEKLISVSPYLFTGLYVVLTEIFLVEVTHEELQTVLIEE